MAPKQLKKSTILELLIAYKNKARCIYTEHKAESIYRELEKRISKDVLYSLRLETWHMQHGEGYELFDEECDKLIKQYEKDNNFRIRKY